MTGADLRQRLVAADRALDQHLHAPAAVLQAVQAGPQHPGVVEHQQVARVQQAGQVGETPVLPARAIDHQQAAGRALRQRELGDQLWRQFVVEIGEG
jgi:hypothetical protein